ncbi:methyltransferase domain-containing protein [Streptomyces sp. DSM 42041]|uniref:Methyltransferase domain-containing protein n=1 Tax=Streptomyces hazeniae TaxID=3075538 RepID=A0ABU2NSR4_9ACTN|nr:methyltransferase domain-containing protein [Streptomyces sp. DSM 42041]MDT0379656.1 methyltransferase domain-containing protein [Streptomyces sp. DSM 42041]
MIRHDLVARQLDEQLAAHFPGGGPLTVLEAGLGPVERTLRLARAGHRVTGLEADAAVHAYVGEALDAEDAAVRERVRLVQGGGQEAGAHFPPGTFDVVLCHDGLTASHDPASTLAGLARVLAPGGLLSVMIRNDAALALHPARAGDWEAALAAFDFAERAFRLEPMTSLLAGVGVPLRTWYGVQVFTPDDDRRALLPRQLAAEERAARTDPYRGVAAYLHLCGLRRPAAVG